MRTSVSRPIGFLENRVGDITYLPISDGSNMYLPAAGGVGFTIADHMRTSLTQDALVMAKGQRGSLADAVFHSDHGSVYTSYAFQETCSTLGIRQSMGAIGGSADNALAESFNAALKHEALQDAKTFPSQLICRRDVFRWCIRYNTVPRHSWCRYLAPIPYSHYQRLLSGGRARPDSVRGVGTSVPLSR